MILTLPGVWFDSFCTQLYLDTVFAMLRCKLCHHSYIHPQELPAEELITYDRCFCRLGLQIGMLRFELRLHHFLVLRVFALKVSQLGLAQEHLAGLSRSVVHQVPDLSYMLLGLLLPQLRLIVSS